MKSLSHSQSFIQRALSQSRIRLERNAGSDVSLHVVCPGGRDSPRVSHGAKGAVPTDEPAPVIVAKKMCHVVDALSGLEQQIRPKGAVSLTLN
jgi:hypothetical protein